LCGAFFVGQAQAIARVRVQGIVILSTVAPRAKDLAELSS
jgi:hypothetical protein